MANIRKSKKQPSVGLGHRKPMELSYLMNQLDAFASVLSFGYSDNNWIIATKILRDLQGHLMPDDREVLSDLMRDIYTNKDEQKVISVVNLLKHKITVNSQ